MGAAQASEREIKGFPKAFTIAPMEIFQEIPNESKTYLREHPRKPSRKECDTDEKNRYVGHPFSRKSIQVCSAISDSKPNRVHDECLEILDMDVCDLIRRKKKKKKQANSQVLGSLH